MITSDYVREKVTPPGTALMVFGGISIAFNLIGFLISLATAGVSLMNIMSAGADPEMIISWLMGQGYQMFMTLISFLVAFVITMGGMRMREARSAGMVYAASILAMIPCCAGCCCVFGLPIGGWAIYTMQDEQVKRAFEA